MKLDKQTIEILQPWLPVAILEDARLVERGPICWCVRELLRQGAMTFAPFIFFGRHKFEPDRISSLALLAHELKHLEQYGSRSYVRFLFRYLRDLAGHRFRDSRSLPLEAECYALQAEVAAALRSRTLEDDLGILGALAPEAPSPSPRPLGPPNAAGRSVEFFKKYLRVALPHLAPKTAIYQWHATIRQHLVMQAWAEMGLHLYQTIVWVSRSVSLAAAEAAARALSRPRAGHALPATRTTAKPGGPRARRGRP